jgi:putative glycosyltransferase (TIGR04348 family)
MKKIIVIVTPALAHANNGNWQTARRWQMLLQSPDASTLSPSPYRVRIVDHWPDADDGAQAPHDDCMLALHARRSAPSIAAWAQRHPSRTAGLAVVLTGTDLYRDIQTDAQAQSSLQCAQRLVVLQELGVQSLPLPLHHKTRVIFQSTPARKALPKPTRFFKALMVGHLRSEKSPETLFAAAALLRASDCIRIDHIGAPLDAALAAHAQATAKAHLHYRWLGALAHEATRRHMQRAHVLVHTSRMEGGAHVVMEAVRCGTPVLASRIAGNVGMLGADYAGYFDWGDAKALLALLQRCHSDAAFYTHLQAQCAARAPLFSAATERHQLHQLVAELLSGTS